MTRLTGRELKRVLEGSQRKRLGHLEVHWMDNSAGHPRIGLIVPKFQSTAVARNRLRRQLGEIWRREIAGGAGEVDVIIRAKRTAYSARFGDLRNELMHWVAEK